ncbi:CBO0543 family protein [Paenibacillus sp. YYML68]|uniref:CBO0543 family protein n=1 Tax=Paenibacillus sp. YYML68 TaxID=2909250 RepID=UPI002492DA47|nr:CBO0543 family protein [Paenibacillus sp. YYML68]
MSVERAVLLALWGIAVIAVLVIVRKKHLHAFVISFMIGQAIIWLMEFGLLQLRLIAYPVREFPNATNMGFSMAYMVYPMFAAIAHRFAPRGSVVKSILCVLVWTTALVLLQYGLARWTELISLKAYHWLWSPIVFGSFIFGTCMLTDLFFKPYSMAAGGESTS